MKLRRVNHALLRGWHLPRFSANDSKEDRGRVLILGGSMRVPGAAMLAATASLRVGAGKLQIATSRQAALALAIVVPEAKVMGLPTNAKGDIAKLGAEVLRAAAEADAVLVGPGMDPTTATLRIASAVMRRANAIVLDAGAIGACMSARSGHLVLTPHVGEMAGMIEVDASEVAANAIAIARDFARASGATLVLKGADTLIASPEGDVWLHQGGCVGLGTSGSGDVLAGLITGLLAQGAPPAQAAVWGVALHARAGDALVRDIGAIGFLASEIPGQVPGIMEALGPR